MVYGDGIVSIIEGDADDAREVEQSILKPPHRYLVTGVVLSGRSVFLLHVLFPLYSFLLFRAWHSFTFYHFSFTCLDEAFDIIYIKEDTYADKHAG